MGHCLGVPVQSMATATVKRRSLGRIEYEEEIPTGESCLLPTPGWPAWQSVSLTPYSNGRITDSEAHGLLPYMGSLKHSLKRPLKAVCCLSPSVHPGFHAGAVFWRGKLVGYHNQPSYDYIADTAFFLYQILDGEGRWG